MDHQDNMQMSDTTVELLQNRGVRHHSHTHTHIHIHLRIHTHTLSRNSHHASPLISIIYQDVLQHLNDIRIPPIKEKTLYENSFYTALMGIFVQSVVYTFSEGTLHIQ